MLFAQRKGGNNLWGHPVEKWTSRRVAKVSSSSVDGPPASRNKTDKSVGVWPVDRPTASPSVSVADFCLCRLSSSRPSSRLPVLAGDTVTLATSKFFQPITITGITNWIRFVKRKTMSPLVAPPCEPIQPCKSFLFISLKKESDDEAAQIFIIIQSIRLDSTGFFFNLKFFEIGAQMSHVSFLLSPCPPYSFSFLLMIVYVFVTHTASGFLGGGLRAIESRPRSRRPPLLPIMARYKNHA